MSEEEGLLGQARQKLIESKRKWAREGRHLTGETGTPAERLPPGQRLVKNWPVLDLGIQPEVPLESFALAVDGLVENPVNWSWADFQAQPAFADTSDIHCVTAWSRYDNHWEGVSARHLLSVVRPKPEARFVVCHSHDGYTTNLPLDAFADEDVLLAHSWEGKPIPTEHGGPVRVVVPKLYFWKSAKWVKRIELTAEDRPGFWEERGYHNEGDPWQEQRYS
ncbi:MAG TPA: sulfite oxidase-like oxidoreductase [Azospirillaceae bacterium]|nr:sulfite oxidase-like oxidoreductase [Azospirillaceae bacterium]